MAMLPNAVVVNGEEAEAMGLDSSAICSLQ
jgi:hypothetical protein